MARLVLAEFTIDHLVEDDDDLSLYSSTYFKSMSEAKELRAASGAKWLRSQGAELIIETLVSHADLSRKVVLYANVPDELKIEYLLRF